MCHQRFVIFFCCSLCALLFVGCMARVDFFRGWEVPVEQIIPFNKDLSAEGRWTTFDVVIDYTMSRQDGQLIVSGQAALTQHYHLLYNRVRNLEIYLFLLDDKGAVLRTEFLLTVVADSTEFKRGFSRSAPVPAAASGFALGYRGYADEWDSHTRFDFLPVRAD